MYQMPPEDLYAYAQVEMGRRIRRARKALGWTQEELGDASGIDQTRISVFERGRKSMHLRTFLKLANALDVDPSELVRGLRLPRGGDPREVAMVREQQRYEAEVEATMTEANERLDAARAGHHRRIAEIAG
ncbi:helix-turn-helix domain-containing protein [Baekduia sp. Peel2402]|uniref:helix-turn-helix domain-containing protein n=1 Tax=Baekduia sp. Peel2402 TaxID=3458296 RepID=UPI00403E8BF1